MVTNDPDRPGNPVLFSGNANNLDAGRGHLGDRAGRPTRRCGSSPSTAPSRASTTATSWCRPTAARPTPPIAGRQDRRRRRSGPALNGTTDGFEPHTLRPVGVRRPDRPARLPLRQRRRRQRGRLARRRHHGRRHAWSATAPAWRRSTRRPRSSRPRCTTGTCGWSASTRAGDRLAVRVRRPGHRVARPGRSCGALSPFQKVVAIVAYDEPTEQVHQYAPYTLTVNGVTQPGGGGS